MKKTLTVLLGLSMALGTVTLSMAKDKPAAGTAESGSKKTHKGKDKVKHHKGDKDSKKSPSATPMQP